MIRYARALTAFTLLGLAAGPAHADDKKLATYLPDKLKKSDKKADGWDGSLVLGASSNLAHNSNVVGVTDGIAWALGAQMTGMLGYVGGQSEWNNKLKLAETYAYTTSLDEFVKTVDELNWKSTYLYYLRAVPWLGPFADLKLKTALLAGYDVQSEEYDYTIQYLDGSSDTTRRRKFRLSDPFRPLNIEESVGAFGKPIKSEAITLEVKAGFGGKHIFADDQFAVDKLDKDTKTIVIKELENVHQGGPALSLGASGSLSDKKVTYNALAEIMFPVINNKRDSDDRNAAELANVLLELNLTFKLVSWASLDYQFKAIREPQLIDKWQLQNNLLLSFTYTLVKERAPVKAAE